MRNMLTVAEHELDVLLPLDNVTQIAKALSQVESLPDGVSLNSAGVSVARDERVYVTCSCEQNLNCQHAYNVMVELEFIVSHCME